MIAKKSHLKIQESTLTNKKAKSIFNYLKELSHITGPKRGQESETQLERQFNQISFVDPQSVLASFLNPEKELISDNPKFTPIFPFGFNLSQKRATVKALGSKISLIEGPPGTGKTQTILNIIANAVIQNQSVAVVSNNNSATSNVYEKLQKYGVDFICASLGKKENKELFFDKQKTTYPIELDSWEMDRENFQLTKNETIKSIAEIEDFLIVQNEVAKLKQLLESLLTEKKYFQEYQFKHTPIKPYKAFSPHNSEKISELWMNLQTMLERGQKPGFKYRLNNLFCHGIFTFSFYRNNPDDIVAFLQALFYKRKEEELRIRIKNLNKKISDFKLEESIRTNQLDSKRLFKAKLYYRYRNRQKPIFSAETALWKGFKDFLQEYPVLLSTTHSLRSCTDKQTLFDYVIMDEASQIDIVAGALALSCAKKAVIVGDLKQLPNVVTSEIKKQTDKIFQATDLKSPYNYASNSLLSSISELFPNLPKTLLKEHYRCHPKIIEFCNQKFYQGQLITLTREEDTKSPLAIYKTVKGNHARGTVNQRQIDVIKEEILPDYNGDIQAIGIVSPYRNQVKKIKQQINSEVLSIDTVHKYQGREKDIIILSTVADQINPFVDDPNLLNVAVSRAVKKLIVIISDNEKNKNTNIGDLIRYVEYNNFEMLESRLYSIFDLLYTPNKKKLNHFKKNRKKISEYESENLMYELIKKVISLPDFQFLGVAVHIPLKTLIRDNMLLTPDELKYAVNSWTHIDFVLFNRMNKALVLAVEVDGHAFHTGNEKQLQRDQIKNDILKKYEIPLLRFSTTESQEEKKLIQKLKTILK